MDQELKQRLIGASVIIALAIIFVPMLFDGEVADKNSQNVSISIPEAGENSLEVKKFELDKPVVESKELPPTEAELIISDNREAQLVDVESVNVSVTEAEQAVEPPVEESNETPVEVTQVEVTEPKVVEENQPAAQQPKPKEEKPAVVVTKPVVKQPATVVSGNKIFRVKLGSFSQQANAERVKSALLQKNIKAIVEYSPGLKLYRVWSQEMYQNENKANDYVNEVAKLNLNIGKPKVITLSAEEVVQMASQGQMGWVVQLGSFSARKNAIELRNKVKASGFSGFVDAITNSSGTTLYRLRIGPLMEKVDAEKTKSDIKQKLKLDGLIKPHELGQIIN